jgi:Glycosyl hydrolases family 28
VAVSNVTFVRIQGVSINETTVSIKCFAAVPCTNLTFDAITLAQNGENGTVSATIQNAYGISEGINIPLISLSEN